MLTSFPFLETSIRHVLNVRFMLSTEYLLAHKLADYTTDKFPLSACSDNHVFTREFPDDHFSIPYFASYIHIKNLICIQSKTNQLKHMKHLQTLLKIETYINFIDLTYFFQDC